MVALWTDLHRRFRRRRRRRVSVRIGVFLIVEITEITKIGRFGSVWSMLPLIIIGQRVRAILSWIALIAVVRVTRCFLAEAIA